MVHALVDVDIYERKDRDPYNWIQMAVSYEDSSKLIVDVHDKLRELYGKDQYFRITKVIKL